jgi:hypothetical protein
VPPIVLSDVERCIPAGGRPLERKFFLADVFAIDPTPSSFWRWNDPSRPGIPPEVDQRGVSLWQLAELSFVLKICKELIDNAPRICERNQMSARQFVDIHRQSFSCDASLELDRKKSIITTGNHVDWNIGPGIETTGLAKHDVGLRALMRLALLDDVRRNIVKKIGGEVEIRAVAAARGRRNGTPPEGRRGGLKHLKSLDLSRDKLSL